MDFDRTRFPRLSRYVDALPQGLDSYANCQAAAALYRQFLEHKSLPDGTGLPSPIAALLSTPLPVSAWMPEAHFVAVLLAVADYHRFGDAEFVQLNREFNREVLGGKFFRVLMSLASPKLLLSGAEIRWGAMHRGTRLSVERPPKSNEKWCRAHLTFPPHLYDELLLKCFETAFASALELSNGRNSRCDLKEHAPERAMYLAQWE